MNMRRLERVENGRKGENDDIEPDAARLDRLAQHP